MLTVNKEKPGVSVSPDDEGLHSKVLSEEAKNQLLFEFNNTKTRYPDTKTVHELFEEQVRRIPDNIAVFFEDSWLTYSELNKKANQLALILREKGVKPDNIVAIMLERSMEMVIGIMGILKAGGAYLPIDPRYPEERVRYLLEDSGAGILLTNHNIVNKINAKVERIDLEDEGLYRGVDTNLRIVNTPEDLAYVIYTSGSTGNPKGVMIKHGSLLNRLNWMQKKYPLSEDDVILLKTTFTFDVSVWELLWWSILGAKVSILKPNKERDPRAIVKSIEQYKVTVMHFVPSILNIFLEYIESRFDVSRLRSLRQVFASGESLSSQAVERFNQILHREYQASLTNLYGPTEATIDVSYFDCSTGEKFELIPIGKPIDNICLYILNKNNGLQPIGVPGELHITGVGLARGYLNRPELNEAIFVPNPFAPNERMYKTGDLARWLKDGNIEFLGRLDHQVKIRGLRIELGEIEFKILNFGPVKEAVVLVKEDEIGNKYLCAYIVSDEAFEVTGLKEYLERKLPDYMIPSYFFQIERMPLTPNGKLDRKELIGNGKIHA